MSNQRRKTFRFSDLENCTLADNSRHQFAANHTLCIYRKNSVFTYIPKNACSTLRYSLALENGVIKDQSQVDWIHTNNETFRATIAEMIKADYTFTVLRDPFTRIASCYIDQIVGGKDPASTYGVLTDNRDNMHRLTFRQFVIGLLPFLDNNVHWRPQESFLVFDDYDDYFCTEDFEEAVNSLSNRIGFDIVDARSLTKHGVDQFRSIDDAPFADVQAQEIGKMKEEGLVPSYRCLYDVEMIDLVLKMYSNDFALYREKTSRSTLFDKHGETIFP